MHVHVFFFFFFLFFKLFGRHLDLRRVDCTARAAIATEENRSAKLFAMLRRIFRCVSSVKLHIFWIFDRLLEFLFQGFFITWMIVGGTLELFNPRSSLFYLRFFDLMYEFDSWCELT